MLACDLFAAAGNEFDLGETQLIRHAVGGDLDGDGHGDWVYAGEQLTILIRGGEDTFVAHPLEADSVTGLKLIDFDADERLDLIVESPESFAVFRNLGFDADGWHGLVRSQTFAGSFDQLVDLNGDGLPDTIRLLRTFDGQATTSIEVRLQDETGLATPIQYLTDGAWSGFSEVDQFAVGDVNNDGSPDIVVLVSPEEGEIRDRYHVFLNDGHGIFDHGIRPELTGELRDVLLWNTVRLELLDYDEDGFVDLVIGQDGYYTRTADTLLILKGDGTGAFSSQLDSFDIPGSVLDFQFADINGDGDRDLVVGFQGIAFHETSVPSGVAVLTGHGGTDFDKPIDVLLSLPSTSSLFEFFPLQVDDFDADGMDEIEVLFRGRSLLTVDLFGETRFSGQLETCSVQRGDLPFRTWTRGDFNNDGLHDWINPNSPLLLGTGTGAFSVGPVPASSVGGYWQPQIADLNGDQLADVVAVRVGPWGDYLGLVSLINKGDQTFETLQRLPEQGMETSVATAFPTRLGDFNGDGKLDIRYVEGSVIEFQVVELLGDGKGFWLETPVRRTVPGKGFVADVQFADLNHDGTDELIMSRTDYAGTVDYRLTVYTVGDNGHYQQIYRSGSQVNEFLLGDLDNDGNLDAAHRQGVLFGDGQGAFPVSNNQQHWGELLEAVDVDGDEIVDLVFTDGRIVYGDPTRDFTESSISPVGELASLLVADVDGDLVNDIIARDVFGIRYFLGKHDRTFSEGSAAYAVDGLLLDAYDADSDGVLDVIINTRDQGLLVLFQVEQEPSDIRGDFNGDGKLDSVDLNLLSAMTRGTNPTEPQILEFDLNRDQRITHDDVIHWVTEIAKTKPGDLDLDGTVSFKDFLLLLADYGKADADWSSGDLDGDRVVGFLDFLILAENFNFKRQS